MTIKIFRLITGEDLITSVKENLSPSVDVVLLEKPAVIMLTQSEDGKAAVGIAPYFPMANAGDIQLRISSIVAEGYPDEQLEQEYSMRFGSGLIVPPKKQIQL